MANFIFFLLSCAQRRPNHIFATFISYTLLIERLASLFHTCLCDDLWSNGFRLENKYSFSFLQQESYIKMIESNKIVISTGNILNVSKKAGQKTNEEVS